jgi:hypothetical protein
LAQIRELWKYAGEDELPPDSLFQAQVEVLRILQIDVPLSAKRQFQLFCSEHFHGLADVLDGLAADQLWALLSMRVQLADMTNARPKAPPSALVASAAVTSSSYSTIAQKVSYRTPMDQASCQRLARSSPPFPGKRSASP